MTTPRLEIDLSKIHHNAHTLVRRLSARGIAVTGVTKAAPNLPEIARTLLQAGVQRLGDSRIENIEAMRTAGLVAPMVLIRSPTLGQADRVTRDSTMSFNSELDVISALSASARRAGRTHGVVLMVELGDLREGFMPGDLQSAVRRTLRFPNISLRGIGANFACLSGASPDAASMAVLSKLADAIDAEFGHRLAIVSGGNSANLNWALSGAETGRINDLRIGEAILLGVEPLHRRLIEGLHSDAFSLVAEVIESKLKPSHPWGPTAENAFGDRPIIANRDNAWRSVLALGHQDVDPIGLVPPAGVRILGASSDHLVIDAGQRRLSIGAEIAFQMTYSALARAMASPYVAKLMQPMNKPGVSRATALIA